MAKALSRICFFMIVQFSTRIRAAGRRAMM
jgi:hypothetical protein